MEDSALVGVEAALAVARGAAIRTSRLIGVLRFLLMQKFLPIFPYFGSGSTFQNYEVGGDVPLRRLFPMNHGSLQSNFYNKKQIHQPI